MLSKVPNFLRKSFIYLNDYKISTLITYKYIIVYYKHIQFHRLTILVSLYTNSA